MAVQQGQIDILIAEDQRLFSESIRLGLKKNPLYGNIYMAQDGEQAVLMVKQYHPQVVLMDVHMPKMSGLQAAQIIKQRLPNTKIVMITGLSDEQTVRNSFSLGVEGYCVKGIGLKSLSQVIQLVVNEGIWIDPSIAKYILKHMVKQTAQTNCQDIPEHLNTQPYPVIKSKQQFLNTMAEDTHKTKYCPLAVPWAQPLHKVITGDVLTPRELELLQHIASGKTNREIADAMKISDIWVEGYIKQILIKLSVDNEVQAVQKAIDDGVFESHAYGILSQN